VVVIPTYERVGFLSALGCAEAVMPVLVRKGFLASLTCGFAAIVARSQNC
jgi:hypothetical protein